MHIPYFLKDFMNNFEGCVTAPSLMRLTEILVARIITIGKSTITNLSRVYGFDPYNSPWHHLFSRYRISLWALSFALIDLIRKNFLVDGLPLVLAVDDTTCLHNGKKVFGKAKHRDAVRSSHSTNVLLWGHKWVVISVIIKLPYSNRAWALPIAVALCRSSDFAKANNCRHKTPAHIARLLIARISRRFPDLTFIIVADQGFGQHATAKAFSRPNLTLVSKFYPDAVLHEEPKPREPGQKGRRRIRGKKLDKPLTVVSKSKPIEAIVSWYGGGVRLVELVSGVGFWYREGKGLVKVRWVYVRDKSGTHRDEYLYSTDVELKPCQIVSLYTGRWAIEVTFQECKEHLKLEKTRVWCKNSVLTLVPLIFGCYSVIVLLYHENQKQFSEIRTIWWPKKTSITFSNMLFSIRYYVWKQQLFQDRPALMRLWNYKAKNEDAILHALCQAA
jgi:DDE superfamily endonuclease